MKHISQEEEETDAPQLGRSLSKKQEERLQRSTTVTSRLTSRGGATASGASARGHPKIEEDSSQHTETDTKHHHHRHKIAEMLGHHSKHKDGLEERKKQEGKKEQDEKGGYHDTPSRTDELDEPQTVCQTPPKNPALISGNDRVGRKGGRHSHHGNPFQHIRRKDGTAESLGDGRVTQALGGEGVFDPRVVHLTLEDMELNDTAAQSNDTAEDSDGMASLSYKDRFSSIPPVCPASVTSPLTFPHIRYLRALPLKKVFLKLFVLLIILLRRLPMFLTIVFILSLIPLQSIVWMG